MAEEFCSSFYFTKTTTLKLQDIVKSDDEMNITRKFNITNVKKPVKRHTRKAFSSQEDEIIKAAMAKVVDGKVDSNFLAKQLNQINQM